MTTRWARFARGWLVAVFSTLVAAASHTIAGGTGPSGVALVIALAFAGLTCIALTGKTVSLLRITVGVGLSQVAFHTVFSTIASSGAPALPAAGPHQHGLHALVVADGPATMAHHTDGWMWLGHAVAAVITIVALRYGESAFWRLREIGALFVRTMFVLLPSVPVLPRVIRRPPVAGHLFVPRICAVVRASLGLRGPPAPSFC